MKMILSLMLVFSALCAQYTRDNVAGIVTDDATGLMWQDDAGAADKKVTWQDADDRCKDLKLGGYDDWRLPGKDELLSLVNRKRTNPAIDPAFKNVISFDYWTSTPVETHANFIWCVDFFYGSDDWNDKGGSDYVRCVRGGK